MILEKLKIFLRSNNSEPLSNVFWKNFEEFDNSSLLEKCTFYAGCLRQLGRCEVSKEQFEDFYKYFAIKKPLNRGQLGRVLYLLEYENDTEFINQIILRGDESELLPLLQVLNSLKEPQQYRDGIINLCRSNSVALYSLISQDNPYPSLYFDDNSFFHLAIKTVFLELEFSKVIGCARRYTDVFGRMLKDFYQERSSAGRKLPCDVINFMKEKGVL